MSDPENNVKFVGKPWLKTKRRYYAFTAAAVVLVLGLIAAGLCCEYCWNCSLYVKMPVWILLFVCLSGGIGDLFQSYKKYKESFMEQEDRGESDSKGRK